MDFNTAIKKLGIEQYGERIFHSNSHGELMHLLDYIGLAQALDDDSKDWFAPWFESIVKWAEETWDHPDYVFQHIYTLFKKTMEDGEQ